MYVVTIGQRVETRTTLAGVLQLLNDDDRDTKIPLRVDDIAVRHIERGAIAVVRLASGDLAVRPAGTARSILSSIIEEVDRFIARVDGKVLRPHEMSRASWGAIMAAGRLGVFPEEVIDFAQADAGPLFHTKDLFEETGHFDIAHFVQSEFSRRFGYGTNGPIYAPDQIPNSRHEVHVAYALLRGEKLRECVLNTYRGSDRYGRHDLQWMPTLIAVPSLRGALPPNVMRGLCQVMRHEKLEITQYNVPKLVASLRGLPADANAVHVDDALFTAGVLPPRVTHAPRVLTGEAAAPVTKLAERIRSYACESQYKAEMERAQSQRTETAISQRHYDDLVRRAAYARRSGSYEWANAVALAVMQRDVASLLSIFDNSKDWNTVSKRALRDELDVDLLQCSAPERRRRIFDLCSFSLDEQSAWEAHSAVEAARARAERELAEASREAEKVRYRLETGREMTGREYVDFCISAGFSKLVDSARGAARRYWIHDPVRQASRPLRAKDGTLSYARARLAMLEGVSAVPA